MSRKLILFDFDGTLVESSSGYNQSLQEFSEARNMPWDSKKMAAGYTDPHNADLGWGIGLAQQPALLEELHQFYFDEMTENNRFIPTVFPDVVETLESLALNYDMGVVTARNRASFMATIQYHQLEKFFSRFRTLCCAQERGYPIKPAPDAVHCFIGESGHMAADVVVVGDTTADIRMAHAAGAKSIAALWGVHTADKLMEHKPTRAAYAVKELPDILVDIF